MTTTHPYQSVEGLYATYDLPTTFVLWTAAMVTFKNSQTDPQTEQRHMEWSQQRKEQDHDQQHE